MAAALVDLSSGQEWTLRRGLRNLLGRSHEADICVPESTVARQHAHFEWTGSGWTLRDTGVGGGSFVFANGEWKRVIEATVRSGDLLRIGRVRTFRFVDDGLPDEDSDSVVALERAILEGLRRGGDGHAIAWLASRIERRSADMARVRDEALRAATHPEPGCRLCAAFVLGVLCRSPRAGVTDRERHALARLESDEDAGVRDEARAQLRSLGT